VGEEAEGLWCDYEKEETNMNDNYQFEKDEYNYHAVAMIFGMSSPKIKVFSAFAMDTFRKHKELKFSEITALNTDNRMETKRNLRLDEHRMFVSDHTELKSGINKIIRYCDAQYNVNIADAMFCDSDFEYFEKNWDATVQNKIRTLGILLRSVHERKVSDIPLLINEFPEITKTLFAHPDFWLESPTKE